MLSITKYGTSLEKLVLHATKLSNRALLTFANSLRQGMCSRLQQLDLSSNDALDVANVASLITDAARLTSLNLSAIRNVGTDIGVIANALLRQTSLRALQLTKCEISNQGLKSLAEALVFNRRIESISIGHAPLTDDGATSICCKIVDFYFLNSYLDSYL